MKIVVCIKQVPDTTEVKLDKEKGTLIRTGIPTIINPDDCAALELALQLKDKHDGHISVLTMGPPQAKTSLYEAISMGADEGILLTDRKFAGSDTWSTSITIAAAIKNLEYDLIICGRQAIDGDTAQVGPQIAEHLGIAQVTYCEELAYEDGAFTVVRQFEQGYFKLSLQPPCLITALSEVTKARYMTVAGIVDAYEENRIKTWTYDDIEVDPSELGLKGSPTRVKKSMTKMTKPAGDVHEVDASEGANIIWQQLKEKKYV